MFYLTTAKKFDWSLRILVHQIDNKTYEKYLLNQVNYDHLPAEKFKDQKVLAIKAPYTFDFLDLSEKHSERELEVSLIRNIQGFLLELCGDFSFMGSQYKLILGGEESFIDLLLFHRELPEYYLKALPTMEQIERGLGFLEVDKCGVRSDT